MDILHKSNPWEATDCNRDDCRFCKSGDEKMIGKCKKRNIVYETECMICKGEMGEADGREREGFGAVPSSQYRNLSGVVPKIESKKDGMEPDMKRAGLNSVKFLGVATIDEKDKRMKDKEKIETTNLIETEYPNVTNTHESSIEGGEAGTGAVLSSRQDVVGVFPEGICRKRKASEAAEDEKKKESEKPPVKYVGETSGSGYERIKEHYKDLENLSAQSHMLKHYIEKHKDIKR